MARFPYSSTNGQPHTLMPRLPMKLTFKDKTLEIVGMLDTGAAVNVLPYSVGIALGATWETQTTSVSLSGNLEHSEARALIVMASQPQIASYRLVRLVFA